MKKYYFVLVLLLSINAFSCDICGGVTSNVSIGVLANTNYHLIGIRNNYRSYSSYINGIKHATDRIVIQELFLRYQWNKRWQVLVNLPYQNAFQQNDFGSTRISGLADPSINVNRTIINRQDTTGRLKDYLLVGMSVKFPLGKNAPTTNNLKNLFPGTGSYDWLFQANYTHQWNKKLSFQTESSYALKGKDQWSYSYGNSLQIGAVLVHSTSVQSKRLITAFGFMGEHFQASSQAGKIVQNATNSASVLAAKLNLNCFTKKWVCSIFLQHPLWQQNQELFIKRNFSGGISLFYLLKKTKR